MTNKYHREYRPDDDCWAIHNQSTEIIIRGMEQAKVSQLIKAGLEKRVLRNRDFILSRIETVYAKSPNTLICKIFDPTTQRNEGTRIMIKKSPPTLKLQDECTHILMFGRHQK